MSYRIDFTRKAQQDLDFHKKAGNMALLKKLLVLLEELSEHPVTGTGKPEMLKHQLSGLWSRRINGEHRLVYEILIEEDPEKGQEGIVVVHSAKGHYW
jgi:toxin YoeB